MAKGGASIRVRRGLAWRHGVLVFSFSGKSATTGSLSGVWPRARLLSALRKRYPALDDLGEEQGFGLYGVTDGDIRFAVVLALVEGAPDKVSEVGFLARFSGFNLSPSQLEGVNRNLHISVAAFHSDGDLYLIGGVAAAGEFNEGTFFLILEAWRRDLLVILQSMSLSETLAGAHPAARLAAVQKFAMNRADGAQSAAALFSSFAGAGRALATCADCAGRGKTGFFARACRSCEGSGFVAVRKR